MSDYDEGGHQEITGEEARLDAHVRAEAEVDEEGSPSDDDPRNYVDSESLASHNLKVIRKHLGVSQQQIADRLPHVYGGLVRLAQTQIAKIERGERPWRVNEIFAIAEALRVDAAEFFRSEPSEEGKNDDHLKLLGARVKYRQKEEQVKQARQAWSAAAAAALSAGLEMCRVAAELEVKDEEVMKFLEERHARLTSLRQEEERALERLRSTSSLEELARQNRESAQTEWEQLVAKARKSTDEPREDE